MGLGSSVPLGGGEISGETPAVSVWGWVSGGVGRGCGYSLTAVEIFQYFTNWSDWTTAHRLSIGSGNRSGGLC